MTTHQSTIVRQILIAIALLALPWSAGFAQDAADAPAPEPIVGAALPGITLPPVKTRPVGTTDGVFAEFASDNNKAEAGMRISVPSKQTITLTPGVNEIVPISRGHLNRIVTPFTSPVVHTTSAAQISTNGAVLYVASADKAPSTLYITPGDEQSIALSLTLLPRAIPPRDVRLQLAEKAGEAYIDHVRAGKWERERPYVQTIKDVMRQLAFGKVPPGYGLRNWKPGDPVMACSQPALSVKLGQVLEGAQLILLTGLITNTTDARVELREATCRHPGVLAVAAWPRVSLAAGASAELYLVTRRTSPEQDARKRPSLITGEGASHNE